MVQRFPEWIQRGPHHWVANYPIGAALLALPVYLPAALGGVDPESPAIAESEKLAASLIVALAAVVMLLTLRRLTSPGLALLFAGFFALGTSNLASRARLSGSTAPANSASRARCTALVRGRSAGGGAGRWIALAGLPLAFSVFARPTNSIMAAALALYVLAPMRRACSASWAPHFRWWRSSSGTTSSTSLDPLRTQWSPTDPRILAYAARRVLPGRYSARLAVCLYTPRPASSRPSASREAGLRWGLADPHSLARHGGDGADVREVVGVVGRSHIRAAAAGRPCAGPDRRHGSRPGLARP